MMCLLMQVVIAMLLNFCIVTAKQVMNFLYRTGIHKQTSQSNKYSRPYEGQFFLFHAGRENSNLYSQPQGLTSR